MSAITDYFKRKPVEITRNKKRKHDEDEGGAINPIEPSVSLSTDTISTATSSTCSISVEPDKKRAKLTESKQESDDEEQPDESSKPPQPPKEITYANCDELIHESWRKILATEFTKIYFRDLRKKLAAEQAKGTEIFPPLKMVFRAFELCPWNALKVVIVGQDPYHDDNQAEGLCFSVQKGIKIPSSLRNMYKEAVDDDIEFKHPGHGSLIQWGEQGVLLLNTVLTVQAHKANSHKKFGWQKFTDAVIKSISDKHDGVVFILWGAQAQKKKKIINLGKHKIVESAHPSGLSAHRGFFGSKPYSKTNAFLKELGKDPINWQIAP